jgi:hypothetical protein
LHALQLLAKVSGVGHLSDEEKTMSTTKKNATARYKRAVATAERLFGSNFHVQYWREGMERKPLEWEETRRYYRLLRRINDAKRAMEAA